MLGCLVGGRSKKTISLAPTAACHQNHLLPVRIDLANYLTAFGPLGYGAQGHLQNFIFTISPGSVLAFTGPTIFGSNVFAVLQVKQRPELRVTAQDDVPTAPAITTIGPTFGYEFFAMKVQTTCAPMSGAGMEFYVVDKIRAGHRDLRFQMKDG